MKLLLISSLSILILILEHTTAAEVSPALAKKVIQPEIQQDVPYDANLNSVIKNELPENLEPPSGSLFQYSNKPVPQTYPSSASDEVIEDEAYSPAEDMETAGTLTIGRHSGRYFGPGIWLGYPSVNRYRNHYHHRPSYSHYPRRYPSAHNPGLWIGG